MARQLLSLTLVGYLLASGAVHASSLHSSGQRKLLQHRAVESAAGALNSHLRDAVGTAFRSTTYSGEGTLAEALDDASDEIRASAQLSELRAALQTARSAADIAGSSTREAHRSTLNLVRQAVADSLYSTLGDYLPEGELESPREQWSARVEALVHELLLDS
ncbi:AP superfamily [Micractinium conductrix]|uniref:AP superfamily n=1 Tax=Micractinium conductrix TaxID=554055 RepID=A0A2P6V0L6_9CHLO|nr:AP superfamily [Micractinium conductrix]|eukprot:PSC67629.1 AP superfamily [Micractinium conductrix]